MFPNSLLFVRIHPPCCRLMHLGNLMKQITNDQALETTQAAPAIRALLTALRAEAELASAATCPQCIVHGGTLPRFHPGAKNQDPSMSARLIRSCRENFFATAAHECAHPGNAARTSVVLAGGQFQ